MELQPEPTIFVGRNGFGKTNLLEALFLIATLGSHRVSSDAPMVRVGHSHATVTATVENAGRELTAELVVAASGANKGSINGRPVRRARELLGVLRTVLFAPEDLALIRGEPGERRRFIDDLVAQLRPTWAGAKADYDRVLRQRAALLKTAGAAMRRGGSDADSVMTTLDVWDDQLADYGAQVTAARLHVLRALQPFVTEAYSSIAQQENRTATMLYRAAAGAEIGESAGGPDAVDDLRELLSAQLREVRTREIERGLCLVGPHRDDLVLELGSEPAKGFASHGESWSYALALRLGSVEILREDGVDPVIMLDDVFAELDVRRRRRLAEFTASAEQLLVTAAVGEDIPAEIGGRRINVGMVDQDGDRYSVITDAPEGES